MIEYSPRLYADWGDLYFANDYYYVYVGSFLVEKYGIMVIVT